jgi:large subunit ribosomal protein L25
MPTPLTANTGRQTGSPSSRRLRAENKIPGVIYGHGMTPMSVSVDRRELRAAVSGAAGTNTVLDLTVDGKVYPSIIKDLQRHPVRRSVTHIDFLQVNLDEAITVSVPLRLEGEATEVQNNNGLVDPAVDSIEVVTTPRSIPAEFVIDISAMTMDTVIRLADVPMPAGVTATGDPDSPVVTVLTMRAEIEEIEAADAEAAEEQAEGAEGEGEGGEAAAAEGDAPAGDDAAE